MDRTVYAEFEDLNAPVALEASGDVIAALEKIAPRWPFELADTPGPGKVPFATVSPSDKGYRLESPHLKEPAEYSNALNAAGAVLVEMAWALLRSRPNLLCLHGAAVEFTGWLVVLPNGKRAGKSTLTACLAASGHRVFTDDFLPLDMDAGGLVQGVACGTAPRLRLPLPDDMGDEAVEWIAEHAGPDNGQYQYLDLPARMLAPHGARMPVGAVVLLERRTGAAARLERIDDDTALKGLIDQNFARAGRPERIEAMLRALARDARAARLIYERAEDAAELLGAEFDVWPQQTLVMPARPAPSEPSPISEPSPPEPSFMSHRTPEPAPVRLEPLHEYDPDTAYRQSPGVTRSGPENGRYLTDPDGGGVYQLDEMSSGIWRMLGEAVYPDEIVATLAAVFPDRKRDEIGRDVRRLLGGLLRARLIEPAEAGAAAVGDDTGVAA